MFDSKKLTNEQIFAAKKQATYTTTGKPYHEHVDCIRIAAEWLDAQRRLKSRAQGGGLDGLKHIIEAWAGRYVSAADVGVAAVLLGLQGIYPRFNISSRLTRPSLTRLDGIGEAGAHPSYRARYQDVYTYEEGEYTGPPRHLGPTLE